MIEGPAYLVATLNELGRFIDPARVTEDGSVVTEYAASGWTSFEVRFEELEGAVAAEVAIETKPQPTVPPRSSGYALAPYLHAARIPAGSNGMGGEPTFVVARRNAPDHPGFEARETRPDRARGILEGIRERLEASR